MRWACRGPVTKWNHQPRDADEVAAAVAGALRHRRCRAGPGPVLLDVPKDVQLQRGAGERAAARCGGKAQLPALPPEADLRRAAELLVDARAGRCSTAAAA